MGRTETEEAQTNKHQTVGREEHQTARKLLVIYSPGFGQKSGVRRTNKIRGKSEEESMQREQQRERSKSDGEMGGRRQERNVERRTTE